MRTRTALPALLKFSFSNWNIDAAALWLLNRNTGLAELAPEVAGSAGADWQAGEWEHRHA